MLNSFVSTSIHRVRTFGKRQTKLKSRFSIPNQDGWHRAWKSDVSQYLPLSPHIRIINTIPDVSMQKMYEDFSFRDGKNRDEPFISTIEKLRAAVDPKLPKPDVMSIRVEIRGAIQTLLVPDHDISPSLAFPLVFSNRMFYHISTCSALLALFVQWNL